jgi:flagellar M-ring protein FliF
MALDLNSVRNKASNAFSGFTRGQKTMLGLAAVAIIIGGFFFLQWASAPSYSPLFSNLPAEEAAAITQELTAQGVDYELADGGSTVMVPKDQVYDLRLSLSAQGLPADGSPGYALLDEQGITASEFRQRVDYQRALEGELSNTISAIDSVDSATVHLVMPEDDLFTDDETHASASVLVDTRDRLPASQVQAIVHLVSSSVEALAPEEVTVADADGNVLWTPGDDGLAAAAGDARVAQTSTYEQQLATSIEEMLAPATGAGRAIVRVSADLDFDRRETTTESFSDTDEAPVVNESTANETYAGNGTSATGVLGPDGTPIAGGGTGTNYESESADRTYAVDKVTEQIQSAPGDVERMSVAVILDDRADVEVSEVERVVAAAAGLQRDRGDTIEVTRLAFDQSVAEEAQAELEAAAGDQRFSQIIDLARTAATVLIVAVVLFLAYRSAKKSAKARMPLALPAQRTSVAQLADLAAAEAIETLPVRALPSPTDERRVAVQAEIGELIDRQSDDVAKMLRGWLGEGKD